MLFQTITQAVSNYLSIYTIIPILILQLPYFTAQFLLILVPRVNERNRFTVVRCLNFLQNPFVRTLLYYFVTHWAVLGIAPHILNIEGAKPNYILPFQFFSWAEGCQQLMLLFAVVGIILVLFTSMLSVLRNQAFIIFVISIYHLQAAPYIYGVASGFSKKSFFFPSVIIALICALLSILITSMVKGMLEHLEHYNRTEENKAPVFLFYAISVGLQLIPTYFYAAWLGNQLENSFA